jgi:hypothetical protein
MPASPADAEDAASPKKNASPGKKKASNMNGNDFAKAIGINKPANVRDKIKRWQQDGGNDAAVAGAEESTAPQRSSQRPPSPSRSPRRRR